MPNGLDIFSVNSKYGNTDTPALSHRVCRISNEDYCTFNTALPAIGPATAETTDDPAAIAVAMPEVDTVATAELPDVQILIFEISADPVVHVAVAV